MKERNERTTNWAPSCCVYNIIFGVVYIVSNEFCRRKKMVSDLQNKKHVINLGGEILDEIKLRNSFKEKFNIF